MQATENLAQNLIETYEGLIKLQEEKRQILINHKIEELGGLDEKILLVCNKGKRAYLLQNRMKFYGYTNTKVLEGGISFNEVEV